VITDTGILHGIDLQMLIMKDFLLRPALRLWQFRCSLVTAETFQLITTAAYAFDRFGGGLCLDVIFSGSGFNSGSAKCRHDKSGTFN
jgi:hypothetical protein